MSRTYASWRAAGLVALGLAVTAEASAQRLSPPAAAVPTPLARAGALRVGDPLDEAGRLQQFENLSLAAGQTVEVALASSDFDAWLTVTGPGGVRVDNDDAPGEGTNARIRFAAPVAGDYRVTVTSAALGEDGAYQLTIGTPAPGLALVTPRAPTLDPDALPVAAPAPAATAVEPAAVALPVAPAATPSGPAHTYGVFVGVSDYPGPGDIYRGAEDAEDLAQAFEQRGIIRGGDSVVLSNARASVGNISRAFLALARRATARDRVVFYFGGHGGHGTLSLYQESLTAPMLAAAMAPFQGQQLVVLDSCYAGTFASMVQGVPGRRGIFSSRADETSYVAEEVQASGWLIYYVLQAVRGDAPTGADGQLQWSELTSYLQRSYQQGVGARQHLALAQGSRGDATLW